MIRRLFSISFDQENGEKKHSKHINMKLIHSKELQDQQSPPTHA